jgi:hypothetical protein
VIELSRLSTEIQIFSVKCHQLTDPKLGVCEEHEECLITIMEVGRERFREAGVMDLFDLFWGKPGFGLVLSCRVLSGTEFSINGRRSGGVLKPASFRIYPKAETHQAISSSCETALIYPRYE